MRPVALARGHHAHVLTKATQAVTVGLQIPAGHGVGVQEPPVRADAGAREQFRGPAPSCAVLEPHSRSSGDLAELSRLGHQRGSGLPARPPGIGAKPAFTVLTLPLTVPLFAGTPGKRKESCKVAKGL